MKFFNSYEDEIRAKAYATLEFKGTYHLAFRDLPSIISQYVFGNNAIDFGCGTGRSTRFLKNFNFQVIGVDISKEMLTIAQEFDPTGDYRQIFKNDFSQLNENSFDLIISAFTFDNIPTMKNKRVLVQKLTRLLKNDGIFINLVSSPEIYVHEWVSFSTKDFPENKGAKSGDVVRIITKDINDKRPCCDIYCTDSDYKKIYAASRLEIVHEKRSLALGSEPYKWVNETRIAPWVIYVLRKK
ncbi:MAG: class I SAM-dependent methyltransferase [Candidatus Thermoplasmatota archaeon]|nr:class I SAM-dependent methyltransferase [Candidatus Thermoplasmatota archaeon]MBU1940567.1 class I SAM-dependent methyltransferase [Candidatus Thermoplasmatota archaeon]